jgi:uncharacterized membrane protein
VPPVTPDARDSEIAAAPTPAEIAAKATGRLEAFSDGVFAIAITLLILDVHVPRHAADSSTGSHLLAGLIDLWPSLLAYFMSFAIILVMWINHHRIFTIVRRTDHPIFYWNGLLLLLVTFVPFPTALLAEYIRFGTAEDFALAAEVYSGTGFLIALAFNALWRHAVDDGRLLTPGHREQEVRDMTQQYRWGPISYLLAFIAAFFSPWTSVGICLALAVFFAFSGLFER